jgi:hypothetical protein
MPYALLPHVRAVAVDEDLVFLDIAADRYLCLPGGGAIVRQTAGPTDDGVWRDLVRQGLAAEGVAAEGVSPAAPSPPIALPARDVVDLAPCPPTVQDVRQLVMAYLDVLVGYRPRSFAEVLRQARRRGPPAATRVTPELIRLCRVFHTLAVWAPVSGKCLERSFFLLRFLQRSGVDAQWMFGVRVWPFRAHCWLQADDVALDDAAERLAAYSPILAA